MVNEFYVPVYKLSPSLSFLYSKALKSFCLSQRDLPEVFEMCCVFAWCPLYVLGLGYFLLFFYLCFCFN